MIKAARSVFAWALVAGLGVPSAAHAGDGDGSYSAESWPLAVIERPLTLASGMLEVRGDTFRANLSEDEVGEPLSLAPDIYVGLSDELTVGVTHEIGVCLTPGADSGCPTAYNDVGLEAIYGLMRGGSFQLAARGGVVMPAFDPFVAGIEVGAVARIRGGSIAAVLDPSLYVGLVERDTLAEIVDVPVAIQFQAQEQTMVFVTTGVRGPLDGFDAAYEVPIGAGAVFAINNRLDLGGELRLDNALGEGGGFERRVVFARAALRI